MLYRYKITVESYKNKRAVFAIETKAYPVGGLWSNLLGLSWGVGAPCGLPKAGTARAKATTATICKININKKFNEWYDLYTIHYLSL